MAVVTVYVITGPAQVGRSMWPTKEVVIGALPDDTAPFVVVVSPRDGDVFVEGGMTIAASAADDDILTSMIGVIVETTDPLNPTQIRTFPLVSGDGAFDESKETGTYKVDKLPAGKYDATITATDKSGNKGSASVQFSVAQRAVISKI